MMSRVDNVIKDLDEDAALVNAAVIYSRTTNPGGVDHD
jgi:hypothetical protein